MDCKICKASFHYCNSCDTEAASEYGICGSCWIVSGLHEEYNDINNIKELLEEDFYELVKQKIGEPEERILSVPTPKKLSVKNSFKLFFADFKASLNQ